MRYTLMMDDLGNRFWLCEHDNGEHEPLPADFALQFYSDVRVINGEQTALPLGTTIELRVPSAKEMIDVQRESLMRVLISAVQREAHKNGETISHEDAREKVVQTVKELLSGSQNPAIAKARDTAASKPPTLILPGATLSAPLREELEALGLAIKT